jgi:hypothetical protein
VYVSKSKERQNDLRKYDMRSQSYSGEPSIQISRKPSIIELDTTEEAERLRIEARKKLDERIKQEEIMREQDIKRQE